MNLVQHEEEGLRRLLRRAQQQSECRLNLKRGPLVQRVVIPEQTRRVAPVGRHGNDREVLRRVHPEKLAAQPCIEGDDGGLPGPGEARDDDEALVGLAVPGVVKRRDLVAVKHMTGSLLVSLERLPHGLQIRG